MSKLRIADKYWIERPYQYAFKTFQVYFCSWLQKAFLNSIPFCTFSLELITREYSLHKEQFSANLQFDCFVISCNVMQNDGNRFTCLPG